MFTLQTMYAVRYTREGDERVRDVYLRNKVDKTYLFATRRAAEEAISTLVHDSRYRQNSGRIEEKRVAQHNDGRVFVVSETYVQRAKAPSGPTVVFTGSSTVVTYTQTLTNAVLWDGAGDMPSNTHIFVRVEKKVYQIDKYWASL